MSVRVKVSRQDTSKNHIFFSSISNSNNELIKLYYDGEDDILIDNDYGIFTSCHNTAIENQWNHIAITVDNNTQEAKLYVNGKHCGGDYMFNQPTGSSATLNYIGARSPSREFFNGAIDEVIFFNRILSSSELSALHGASSHISESSLEGLDDGSYSYTGYAVTSDGNESSILRNVIIDDSPSSDPLIGDINNDGSMTLADAIVCLKVLTGNASSVHLEAEVNGDQTIGIADVIWILHQL